MVEYDIFGFPKTKEMEQLKKQLGLNAQIEEEVEGNFIANPEWKQRYGVNKDYDIEEEDMDEETRELNRFLEEDEDVEENEEIDANFIKQLNENKRILEERTAEDDMKEVEEDEDHGFIPPGLSEEMTQVLINARKVLKERKAKQNKEEMNTMIQDALEELNDDDEEYEEMGDEIDKDDFQNMLDEYI